MKKLFFAFILSIVACMATSCLLPPEGSGTQGGDDTDTTPLAYAYLIKNDASIDLMSVRNAFLNKNGKALSISDDSETPSGREIVFGESTRAVTSAAKSAFDSEIEYEPGDCVGYIIFKNTDGAISVWWNYEDVQEDAMQVFLDEYCDISVLEKAASGILACEFSDLDEYLYKKAWSDFETKYEVEPETLAMLKELYAYYDGSAIVDWAAELWDPYVCVCGECAAQGKEIPCYGGGFYYANSARDYDGFLPDLESISQLVGLVNNLGAFPHYGNSVQSALPDDVVDKLVAFTQACLDKDSGYFYHPQWGSEIGAARRGRDLGHGISILNWFKVEPKYPTALDRLNGTASASAMTMSLGRSAATAVSYVKAAALSFEESLGSEEDYMEWLLTTTGIKVDEDGNYDYSVFKKNSKGAHTISSVTSQIKAAGYLEMTLDFFDAAQDAIFEEALALYEEDPENNPPPTGLWQVTADYPMVWGLLKLGSLYSTGNRRIRYEEYAMRACVEAILIDPDSDGGYGAGKQYHMNDVYNCWTAPQRLITQAKEMTPELLPTLYEIARERAPEMIEISMRRLDKFKQDDGSFGYNFGTSSPTTQGVPVSLGFAEGDVNATALAHGMYSAVFTVLGYSRVKLCDYRDGDRFLQTLSEMRTPNKIFLETEPVDFDITPTGMTSTTKNGSSVDIVTDPEDTSNNVLWFNTIAAGSDEIDNNKGVGSSFSIKTQGDVTAATCMVMEFDMYIDSISAYKNYARYYQITMGNLFMLEIINNGDGSVKFGANATTSNTNYVKVFDTAVSTGQWFTIRVEYYVDEEAPKIKVFVDEQLIGETDIYYGSDKEGSVPGTSYAKVGFTSMKRTTSSIYIDNAFFTGINAEYTDSQAPNYGD